MTASPASPNRNSLLSPSPTYLDDWTRPPENVQAGAEPADASKVHVKLAPLPHVASPYALGEKLDADAQLVALQPLALAQIHVAPASSRQSSPQTPSVCVVHVLARRCCMT